MSWLWEYALPFAAVLGSVVLFHEFGHYLVAKWLGITVEIFSVGFGPRITGFVRDGTDYRLSWIPLGGYVKLKGESPEESGSVPDPGDLLSRPRWQRLLVFVMGAVFNLLTALVLAAAIFMHGVDEPAYPYEPPIVGEVEPGSPAERAGIQPGDRILGFGGEDVTTWKELELLVVLSPRQTKEVILKRGEERLTTRIDIASDGRHDIGIPGFRPRIPVVVGQVIPGRPAESAGLRRGDQIVAIDGVPQTRETALRAIQGSGGRPLRFTLRRDDRVVEVPVTPAEDAGVYRIGCELAIPTVLRAYPFAEAFTQSVRWNLEQTRMVFVSFRKLLAGELSLRAFSGPIELYIITGQQAQQGLIPFLQLIAFISLQLGIINLFPIPPLDGGHIFTLLIEGAIRRDLSARLKERVMQAGLILLLVFMGAIIYFDISKIRWPFFR